MDRKRKRVGRKLNFGDEPPEPPKVPRKLKFGDEPPKPPKVSRSLFGPPSKRERPQKSWREESKETKMLWKYYGEEEIKQEAKRGLQGYLDFLKYSVRIELDPKDQQVLDDIITTLSTKKQITTDELDEIIYNSQLSDSAHDEVIKWSQIFMDYIPLRL